MTLSIQDEYADLIHEDATVLLRPRTGLQDITVEVDAGSGFAHRRGELDDPRLPDAAERAAGRDPCLARRRHQAYLRLLLQGGAEGFGGNGEKLSAGCGGWTVRARRGEDQRTALPAAAEHPQLDPQLPRAVGRAGAQRHPARRFRRLLQRRPARSPTRRRRSATLREFPPRCARRSARSRAPTACRWRRRRSEAHARGADARTGARGVAPVLQPDHRPDQAADPPVRGGCRSRSGTSSRPPRH